MRYTEYHAGKAVIKDKSLLPGAMAKLASYEDLEEHTSGWIPVEEQLPEEGRYILLSFSNFSLPALGRYESDTGGGAFYLGDCDEEDTCIANDLYVNAWMSLPEPYRPENLTLV